MESQFSSLEREQTGEDSAARLVQIRQLVSSLNSYECRYMKILLPRDLTINIIGGLPIELVRQIAELLSLRDFFVCLTVSRRWRDKLLSTPVIGDMLRKFAPSSWQLLGDNRISLDESLQALSKRGRARWGHKYSNLEKPFSWEDESYFKLDPTYHDIAAGYAKFGRDGGPQDEDDDLIDPMYMTPIYSNGKIAWLAQRHFVVVDNLWTQTRKVYTVSRGPLLGPVLRILALGDRLLVGCLDRILVAWDHITNIYQEKKLPGFIKHAETEGSRVAIILFSGDVFLWDFGGTLTTLPTAPLMNYHGFDKDTLKCWISNLRVIFHPVCTRTLFLASAYNSEKGNVFKQVVYEFKDNQHVKTFEAETSPCTAVSDHCIIRKALPYRRDIIGFYGPFVNHWKYYVEFDIYDRRFAIFSRDKLVDWREIRNINGRVGVDSDFQVGFHVSHPAGFSAFSFHPDFDFKLGG
ncbi:hypothetical protein GGR54DRAFT_27297 [Hypoxylon sp. NC1633]|nr:hypothetical protein GGR54DRAFT_27297 [Hypoxylon sp. NC1633]